MIDSDGYRPNVGIILTNSDGQLLWARRIRQDAWQFPQGGMRSDETPVEAMYRELHEEVGLRPADVEMLGMTEDWLRYRLPDKFVRRNSMPLCIGQKQRWFLLRVLCNESDFCLDSSEKPEFDHWKWVKYWYPVDQVVYFKRNVYAQALNELAPILYPDGIPGQFEQIKTKSRRIRLYR